VSSRSRVLLPLRLRLRSSSTRENKRKFRYPFPNRSSHNTWTKKLGQVTKTEELRVLGCVGVSRRRVANGRVVRGKTWPVALSSSDASVAGDRHGEAFTEAQPGRVLSSENILLRWPTLSCLGEGNSDVESSWRVRRRPPRSLRPRAWLEFFSRNGCKAKIAFIAYDDVLSRKKPGTSYLATLGRPCRGFGSWARLWANLPLGNFPPGSISLRAPCLPGQDTVLPQRRLGPRGSRRSSPVAVR